MKNNEWKELSATATAELMELLPAARAELGLLEFSSPGRQLKNAHARRNLKKRVARLQLLLSQRHLQSAS